MNSQDARVMLGYFQVNDKKLSIEWFGYQWGAIYFPDIGFTREWAGVDGDDIVIEKGKTREWGSREYPINQRYKRQHLDGLEKQPDW